MEFAIFSTMFLYISSRTTDLFCGYEDSNTPVNTQKLSAFQVVVLDTRLVLITGESVVTVRDGG